MSQTSELTPFTTQEKLVLGGYATQVAGALVGLITITFSLAGVVSWKVPAFIIPSFILISFVLWAVALGSEVDRRPRIMKWALWAVVTIMTPLLIVGSFL